MLNSIRYRLLAWFILFMLLTLGVAIPIHLGFRHKEKQISSVSNDISTLHIEFLRDNVIINDFLTTEPANADFFLHGESNYLMEHSRIFRNLNTRLPEFSVSKQAQAFRINEDLNLLSSQYSRYNSIFDSLVYLVYKRGYRNYGLRGELADYAQKVQNALPLVHAGVLDLRDIHSAYLINYDPAYIAEFNRILQKVDQKLQRSVSDHKILSFHRDLLHEYGNAFVRLADLEEKAGITGHKALRASLHGVAANIETTFSALEARTASTQLAVMQRLKYLYLISLLVILALAVYSSYLASRHLVSHLEALSNYISFLAKNEKPQKEVNFQSSTREIRQIYLEFRNLLSQLKIWEKQRNSAMQFADDNQQRYRELADMLPQSVFETDSYGNYTYVNKAWYQAFGYTPEELNEGLNLIETLVSESGNEDILGIQKIENCTFMAVRRNGSRFPASVYTDNILNNGKINGRRGIIIDITERVNYIRTLQQETSKAKTSDELKSSFLANMSHEIRTPMNSIIGFSNLLASDQVPDIQKKDFTHYIQTSSEFLLNLVDDIIDFAKIEAGELKIVKKECDLGELCNELLTTLAEIRKKYNKQHLQMKLVKDSVNPDILFKTDPFRLRQILVNLIINAIKFTDKGTVEFGYTVKDETQIEFFVKDTGPGLSREDLDQIFERFKRTRRSTEKNIAGTGLGLAISKNLVQLLGGEMWVNSVAGAGTTFLFTLPYLKITRLNQEAEANYTASESYNWKGRKILVVEDDLNSFKFLSELFKKTGIEVIAANTGKEAVEKFSRDRSIDLILMDIQLPVMDGLEATRIIKGIRPNVPVIAQTAHAMAGDKEKMKEAGCDDYIPKPLNSRDLQAIINHYLTGSADQTGHKTSSPSAIISNPRSF